MKYGLFENGVDSFKAAFNSIKKIKADPEYHHYKDAILSINHANEVLFKYILKEKLELLIFSDINSYIKAKGKLKNSGKRNVLEVDNTLKTVNIIDAINRLKDLCDVEVNEAFHNSVLYLNNLRNKIMHYEIDLTEEEVSKMHHNLLICYELSIGFLKEHIEGIEDSLENARYELTDEEIKDMFLDDLDFEVEEWETESLEIEDPQ
ncbi:hypothetical protein LOZ80_14415 [Paenibacillus sp. HWE-109]|uniref:hypothetical protein n=1 Tax=Paenibacillus sp. HWE-109 TaxID=1306526 RepID=UPI001EDD4804|nr:hypothetical protein [Paenibacillus sp. HWE-109]UKS30058.1 hypothetical protein LOZ80_14415 [Paenibacillus sp. HWE-109]